MKFATAYQEVLLDNVNEIIKQNFIFQAQLKLLQNVIAEKNGELEKYGHVVANMQEEREQLSKKLLEDTSKKTENRLQMALNESMKDAAKMKDLIETTRNALIAESKANNSNRILIEELEKLVPKTKLKKIKEEIGILDGPTETAKVPEAIIEKTTDTNTF